MDWKGQRLAEELMQYLLVASAVIAFVAGYCASDFQLMMKIFAGGAATTALLVLFDWPWYNRNSLNWIDAKTAAATASRPVNKTAPKAGPKKKKESK